MSSTEDVNSPIDSKNGSPMPSIPISRPLRKAHTVDASLEASPETDNNDSKKEETPIEQEPSVPAHRPIRRSTTEDIDNLVNNTNEELEEMEKLIHKHSHHHARESVSKEVPDLPNIPQRPHPKKKASAENATSPQPKIPQRPTRRSTSPLKTATSGTDEEPNKDNGTPTVPPIVPQQRPLKRKTSTSPESSTPLNVGSLSLTESESLPIPVVPKERPSRTKKSVSETQETSSLDEDRVGDNLTEKEVKEEQINTTNSDTLEKATNVTVGIPLAKEQNEKIKPKPTVTEVNEEIKKTLEELSQEENITDELANDEKSISEISEKDESAEEEEVMPTKSEVPREQSFVSEENSEANPVKSNEISKDDNEPGKGSHSYRSESENTPELSKVEKQEEVPSEKETTGLTFGLVPQDEDTTNVKLTKTETKQLEEQSTAATNSKETSEEKKTSEISKPKEEPHIPATRPKKKGPPPVPKKPSSRIAAFQEMLQKQQMKDMENNGAKQSPGNHEKEPPRKMNFINDLNNLIALPGMVPPGAAKPTSDSNTTEVKKELSDVRQKRARGPRGRKLPSKVNSVVKVIAKNENYVVKVNPLWSLKIVSKPLPTEYKDIEKEEKTNEEAEEVVDRDGSDPYDGYEKQDEQQTVNIEVVEEQESRDQSTDLPELSPNPVLKSTSSLSDSILSRDEDGRVLMMEENLEARAEKEMQEQFIEEDRKFTESLNQQAALNIGDEIENIGDEIENIGDEIENIGDEIENIGDEIENIDESTEEIPTSTTTEDVTTA